MNDEEESSSAPSAAAMDFIFVRNWPELTDEAMFVRIVE